MVPHHIPENLSEMTYYFYLARVTPIEVLRSVVRSRFTSRHYPPSMEHLYALTPDECIAEFYLDATENIISSIFNITSSLKKGGLWINVGPLKYHGYHNTEFQPRLNWDEVILLCESMPGITVLHSDQIENVKYTQKNVSSTIDTETYTCCVLVAVVN